MKNELKARLANGESLEAIMKDIANDLAAADTEFRAEQRAAASKEVDEDEILELRYDAAEALVDFLGALGIDVPADAVKDIDELLGELQKVVVELNTVFGSLKGMSAASTKAPATSATVTNAQTGAEQSLFDFLKENGLV